jgi:predicted AlkP superfamily pyrophosphatase or phosphodiesterase
MDSAIVTDLVSQKLITQEEVTSFGKSNPAWRDRLWTDAAIDILTKHIPNLLLFHLLQTDTLQHEYGPLTPAAYAAYAYADSCIARLVDAARAAGLLNRVTFILASDHGFGSDLILVLSRICASHRQSRKYSASLCRHLARYPFRTPSSSALKKSAVFCSSCLIVQHSCLCTHSRLQRSATA